MPSTTPQGPSTPFATLNGLQVVDGTVRVPGAGAWTADVRLDAAPIEPLSTAPRGAVLVVGDLTLTGTLQPSASGDFVDTGWYRIVGGAGAWSSTVAARAYHNDAGIRLGTLLADLAADIGEGAAVVDDAVGAARVRGVDYVRARGQGGRTLAELLALSGQAGATWWVAYDGSTHVGARGEAPVAVPADVALDVLDYHPAQRQLELASDSLALLSPGGIITAEQLPSALILRELEIAIGETVRVRAWVDDEAARARPIDSRLVRALRAAVRDALPELPYLGLARYRVSQMVAGRANLQAVDSSRGLPDLRLVRLAPGLAGATSTPTLGAIVLVAFADADPSQPLIVSYAPDSDGAFASTAVAIGGAGVPVSLAGGSDAVALAGPIKAWADEVRTALNAASISVPKLQGAAAQDVRAS